MAGARGGNTRPAQTSKGFKQPVFSPIQDVVVGKDAAIDLGGAKRS